jgi:hypothetical protein
MSEEHLTDGWEPDLPVSDTLLRPLPFDRPGDTLGAVEEFFGGGRGEAYLWSAWPTPDLRPRGWVLEGHPPLLLRPPGSRPPPSGAPPGLRVERITGVAGLRDWERVAVDGFPYRELQPYRPGALLDEPVLADQRLRLWVGYEGERPVCVGSLFVAFGLAAFSLGVTLPEARRRGYWAAMAGVRLLEEPVLPAVGVFSDMSRPSAEALGFLPITRFTLWHRPRPAR